MNTSYGYQLYQAERTPNRADILAAQDQTGLQAAAVMRLARGMARILSAHL